MAVLISLNPGLRKKILHDLFVVASSSFFICALLELYVGWYFLAKLSTFFGAVYIVIWYFFKSKKLSYLEDFIFIGSNLIIFFYSGVVGKEANFHLYFFCLLIGVPILIPTKYSFRFFFHLLSPLLSYLVLRYFNFCIISNQSYSDNAIALLNDFNFITTGFILGFFVYSIIILNKASQTIMETKEVALIDKNTALEKANKELDKFVYSIGHDLRSPISSVLGLLELSKDESDLNQLKSYLKLQEESVQKLDGFIKEILDYSRNERLEKKSEEINLKQFCEALVAQHKYSETAKNITFFVHALPKTVFIDKLRLTIIISNLLSNAITYSDSTKPQKTIEVFADVNNNNIEITVKDNGVGIDEQYHNKIFDMFFRASLESKGTGLGLYIVKEAVNKLNGKISVSSVLGQGTSVLVELPIINN